jgi:hypothetical protein
MARAPGKRDHQLDILNQVPRKTSVPDGPYATQDAFESDLRLLEAVLLDHFAPIEKNFIPSIFCLKENTFVLSPWVDTFMKILGERLRSDSEALARARFVLGRVLN